MVQLDDVSRAVQIDGGFWLDSIIRKALPRLTYQKLGGVPLYVYFRSLAHVVFLPCITAHPIYSSLLHVIDVIVAIAVIVHKRCTGLTSLRNF